MELQKLKYFHTAAKLQHMTRAAETLCIAQPALTQAIKSLERELGVELFARRGRNIVLTECGTYLKDRLDTLLPELDGLPEELARLKHRETSTIRLNILAASTFVIDTVVQYRRMHPGVVFDLEQNARMQFCDIVVTTNGAPETGAKGSRKRYVKEERIYLAVPKDSAYARCQSIDLREVREEGFVLLSSSRLFGVICNSFCSIAGFTPKILFESDSPAAVQNIISTGTGVAFWPEHAWGPGRNQNVVLLPISYPVCQRQLIFELHDRTPTSRYAEDFYEFLLKQI